MPPYRGTGQAYHVRYDGTISGRLEKTVPGTPVGGACFSIRSSSLQYATGVTRTASKPTLPGRTGHGLCPIRGRSRLAGSRLFSNFKSIAESCSRQLRGWADYLQNSEIKGQRHLNDQSRRHYDAAKTAEEFERELLERLPPDHPLRKRPRQL